MTKELKDYLHLYLGCKVKYLLIGEGILSEVSLDSKYGILVSVKLNNGPKSKHIQTIVSNIKPILRPLSDLTDEEEFDLELVADVCVIERVSAYQFDSEKIRYLLSKHFDLFGLIESGLAINALELNIENKVSGAK